MLWCDSAARALRSFQTALSSLELILIAAMPSVWLDESRFVDPVQLVGKHEYPTCFRDST